MRQLTSISNALALVTMGCLNFSCAGQVSNGDGPDETVGSTSEALMIAKRADGGYDRFPRTVQRNITYCISDGFNSVFNGVSVGVKATIANGYADATAAWADAADVNFVYVPTEDSNCAPENPNVQIAVFLNPAYVNGQAAASPYSDPNQSVSIGCTNAATNDCRITSDRDYYRRLLIHEVGHSMGFVHEFEHPAGPCPTGGNYGILTAYDPESAMNYVVGSNPPPCVGTATQTYITDKDRQGSQLIYGIPWESLGGPNIAGRPTIASWGTERLDVFARGTDNALWHLWYDGAWHSWESLGGSLSSPPAAVSVGAGQIDLVARGTDNAIWHVWYDRGFHWESLGGPMGAGSPAVASWAPNRFDVFARGTDNQLWHRWWDNGWFNWEPLGGNLTSGVGAVSRTFGVIDVVGRGTDGGVWVRTFNGGWQPWKPIGAPPLGDDADPALDSQTSSTLDLYVVGSNNGVETYVYRSSMSGGTWSSFSQLGDFQNFGVGSGVNAVSWAPGRIDLVATRQGSARVQHAWFANGAWR